MRTRSSRFALVMLAAFAEVTQAAANGIDLAWGTCDVTNASSGQPVSR